jgi:flagellar basal-body rod protein FlgF
MDRLIYTALTGMKAAANQQRVVANNLANASTTGFKAEEFAVTPVTIKGSSWEARAMAQGSVKGADLGAGTINQTGRSLDIAMRGSAMLALQAPDGSEVYSRRGDLTITADGVLQNGDGLPVMGNAGPITVPLTSQISIAEDGSLLASDPAAPDAPPLAIGRMKLASVEGSQIYKDIEGWMRVPDDGILPDDPTARIEVGALESSNVNTATTLVNMIEAQRAFEQRAKIISTADELDQTGARLMSLRG